MHILALPVIIAGNSLIYADNHSEDNIIERIQIESKGNVIIDIPENIRPAGGESHEAKHRRSLHLKYLLFHCPSDLSCFSEYLKRIRTSFCCRCGGIPHDLDICSKGVLFRWNNGF